jgi:hypothetical protein
VYQQAYLEYPEMWESNDGLSLIGGYRLDFSHTQLLHATVTCQHYEEIVWYRDIPEPPAEDKFSLLRPTSPKTGPSVDDSEEGRRAEGM